MYAYEWQTGVVAEAAAARAATGELFNFTDKGSYRVQLLNVRLESSLFTTDMYAMGRCSRK